METAASKDHRRVREERQSFDPAGHDSRPDVTRLTVDRRRQSTLNIETYPAQPAGRLLDAFSKD